MGAVASGPPPWGKIVVLVAVRLFRGTGGNRRRPEIKLSVLSFVRGSKGWALGRNFWAHTFFDNESKIWYLPKLFSGSVFFVSKCRADFSP